MAGPVWGSADMVAQVAFRKEGRFGRRGRHLRCWKEAIVPEL